jgi:hypothetical protein
VNVAPAADTAFSQAEALTMCCEIGNQIAGFKIRNDGSYRHPQFNIDASSAVTVGTPSWLTIFGGMRFGITVVNQGIDVAIGNGIDTTAAPAIATIGSAKLNELFSAHGSAASATVASNYFDSSFVNKFHE